MILVKICGITSVADGLAAAAAGATAIGLNFYPRSPRYVTPEQAAAIAAALPSDILKVGVFVNEPPESIERIARSVGLDVVQLHGDETPADVPTGLRIWKAAAVRPGTSLTELFRFPAEAFLLDAPAPGLYGGGGATFDWRLVAAQSGVRIVLAGGLSTGNVAEAIHIVQPWGVDACSRLESAPGVKDHTRMQEFVAAARAASSELVSL